MQYIFHKSTSLIWLYVTPEEVGTKQLRILSNIRMDKLDSFNKWLLEEADNHEKIIPFLVAKMLRGDIFALNMFDNLCQYSGKEDFIVSYTNIHNNDTLKNIFAKYGGAEDARAIMTAENWLASESATIIGLAEHNVKTEEITTV